ncbi:general stress protein [Paenibacillus sp. J2TS4]|uniref:general stress protein n=1 Tax=Paenibacillus sp. J2TS4 TaxID=2807194 RepID=UPI001AFCDCB5|nr:general stress protein [Paenibacillus sp. J2TS4]GIP33179.1 hypothetical protein J2TS4_23890 [Paenibacillus sp. J2TS4]
MIKATKVHTVGKLTEAQEQVNEFLREGYAKDHVYVLTHDRDRTERVADRTDAEQIGVDEEGLGTAVANLFRSRGNELRAQMRALGISPEAAERLEREMDNDKIVVIGWGGEQYDEDRYDPHITYYPPYVL